MNFAIGQRWVPKNDAPARTIDGMREIEPNYRGRPQFRLGWITDAGKGWITSPEAFVKWVRRTDAELAQ